MSGPVTKCKYTLKHKSPTKAKRRQIGGKQKLSRAANLSNGVDEAVTAEQRTAQFVVAKKTKPLKRGERRKPASWRKGKPKTKTASSKQRREPGFVFGSHQSTANLSGTTTMNHQAKIVVSRDQSTTTGYWDSTHDSTQANSIVNDSHDVANTLEINNTMNYGYPLDAMDCDED